MTRERLTILCLGTVVALSALGCQRIVDVSGTVRVDGKPARGLVVIFDPDEKDAPRGVAQTTADGGYRLRRLGPGSMTGVPAGRYTVKVMPDMDDPGAPQIPATYFRSSGLTHDVGRSSPDTYDIEISTK
jgi:hypothetical protein